jgi:hypothetical protein
MHSSTEVAQRLTVQTEKKLNDGDNPFSTELCHAEGAGGTAVIEKSVANGGMRANRNSPSADASVVGFFREHLVSDGGTR